MVDSGRAIDAVFLDIGGTLGERDATGRFVPYPTSLRFLEEMRDRLRLRIGIITTLGSGVSSAQMHEMLELAGLAGFVDTRGFVSDHEAGVAKPDVEIYHFAANALQLPPERCLFIGENLVEVIGAIVAGMKAVLKPGPPGRELSG